jgi:2-amino-4-hydroxy-6-hydroxymethyldihydropteridine diphosphokinase
VWRSNEATMNQLHKFYLNLGSNINPEINLVMAIHLLDEYGEVRKISQAWESKSVGASGPNFLNSCAFFLSALTEVELKEQVIRPIEAKLGRKRNKDKFFPRTIDIDIILFDDQPYSDKFWEEAFVIIPLAEIYPEYQSPKTGERISDTAVRLLQTVWMKARPDVLSQFSENSSKV